MTPMDIAATAVGVLVAVVALVATRRTIRAHDGEETAQEVSYGAAVVCGLILVALGVTGVASTLLAEVASFFFLT